MHSHRINVALLSNALLSKRDQDCSATKRWPNNLCFACTKSDLTWDLYQDLTFLDQLCHKYHQVLLTNDSAIVKKFIRDDAKMFSWIALIDLHSYLHGSCSDFVISLIRDLLNSVKRISIIAVLREYLDDDDLTKRLFQAGTTAVLMHPLRSTDINLLWTHSLNTNSSRNPCSYINIGLMHDLRHIFPSLTDISELELDLSEGFPTVENGRFGDDVLKSWNFNPHKYGDDELLILAYRIFESSGMLTKFSIPQDKLQNFLKYVRLRYRSNPYHNFRHAVDVLQATFYFLFVISCKNYLYDEEILALLVSAYCHDIAHPGCSNFFLINSRSSVSLIYNDKSVLENYHSLVMFSLLDREDCNILVALSRSARSTFRMFAIENVLATDMSLHFRYIDHLLSRAESEERLNIQNKSDRLLISASILKCADISNQGRNCETAQAWANLLMTEFFNQGRIEKSLDYPVNVLGDERLVSIPTSQYSFIRDMVKPLYEAFNSHILGLDFILEALDKNMNYWQGLI